MRIKKSLRGIVLRTTHYSEANVIGTLLTLSDGLLNFVARGAKTSKKRLGGGIEILDYATFDLNTPLHADGLFELASITERAHWPSLRTSTSFFCSACLLTEIVLIFCKTDEDVTKFFSWLTTNLDSLNISRSHLETLNILFLAQISALQIIGLDPKEDPNFKCKWPTTEELTIAELIGSNKALINYFENYMGYPLKAHDAINLFVLKPQRL